jgi:hypothetical protein
VKELRETRMKWKDIAWEMRVSEAKMSSYRVMLSRSKKSAHVEQSPGRRTCSLGPTSPQSPPIASLEVS